MTSISISYDDPNCLERAQTLATQLDLPLKSPLPQSIEEKEIRLIVTQQGLYLSCPPFLPMQADFNLKTWQHRRNAGKQQGLVRACKPGPGIRILDATAGWGRDAAILASFGAKVCMLERHPVMGVLLEDALLRRDERSQKILNLHVRITDAFDYLQHLKPHDYPDVIYLDPMHPQRENSALVKKDMQILQQLAGFDEHIEALLLLARSRVQSRVVLKWPTNQKPIQTPSFSVPGKTVRFDVYLYLV